MHFFFSVGEPSGDEHAAHLIAELRKRVPNAEFSGYGGPQMAAAGQRQDFQLTDLAVMGLFKIIPLLGQFIRLARLAKQLMRERKPDALILVDFPGFNFVVAKAAKKLGIPVIYYMPPQMWAWGGWRIGKIRRTVDRVLCGLSFEAEWYADRGVDAVFVGHPFFDAVAEKQLDEDFLVERSTDERRTVGILPGSRGQEIARNWPIMLDVMQRLAAKHPNVNFRVANYREEHRTICQAAYEDLENPFPVEFSVGKTSEIIELAECCLIVSGSVSLEVMARRTPAVVVFRYNMLWAVLDKIFLQCRFITLVNLIAGREVMPEFRFASDDNWHAEVIADAVDRWLACPQDLDRSRRELSQLAAGAAEPGATSRAADAILERLGGMQPQSRVAA
ncbi:lipid-A-disaccharide synthase [Stratiformator vulcanicus]|uniref:Lipid-A-disaccharide synthase n=1 Tax=Stratiformator vulcanicus TaxID=2527980 RepID=A0A517R4J6_9PLAN|nr:lipid-A-disaccharide synthase [Stratiformator vulcanicus]QDT38791.1 Glycosyl transferase [Stratiformator vulcanicus]